MVAASFQDRIVPSRSFDTIASSEFSTIAARCWLASKRRRSVMSRAKPAAATIRPEASRTGDIESETSIRWPSLWRRSVSVW